MLATEASCVCNVHTVPGVSRWASAFKDTRSSGTQQLKGFIEEFSHRESDEGSELFSFWCIVSSGEICRPDLIWVWLWGFSVWPEDSFSKVKDILQTFCLEHSCSLLGVLSASQSAVGQIFDIWPPQCVQCFPHVPYVISYGLLAASCFVRNSQ